MHVYCNTYRTCACILHVFTFLLRQSDGELGGEWQLSARKTNRLRAAQRARSPGTLRNILSTTGLPGSTPDTAPGTASLGSQITASEPRQGGERPRGPRVVQEGYRCFVSDSKKTETRKRKTSKWPNLNFRLTKALQLCVLL